MLGLERQNSRLDRRKSRIGSVPAVALAVAPGAAGRAVAVGDVAEAPADLGDRVGAPVGGRPWPSWSRAGPAGCRRPPRRSSPRRGSSATPAPTASRGSRTGRRPSRTRPAARGRCAGVLVGEVLGAGHRVAGAERERVLLQRVGLGPAVGAGDRGRARSASAAAASASVLAATAATAALPRLVPRAEVGHAGRGRVGAALRAQRQRPAADGEPGRHHRHRRERQRRLQRGPRRPSSRRGTVLRVPGLQRRHDLGPDLPG